MANPSNDHPTGKHRVDSGFAAGPGSNQRWSAELSGRSHVGRVRENNEDHFLVARLDRTWQTLGSNLPVDAVPAVSTETVYGMLVADGMGGRAAGEVASRVAISTLVDLVLQTPDIIMRLDPLFTEEALQRFDERFQQIKKVLTEKVLRDPELAGMGTTMTLAANAGADLLIAHVGDSRAYLFRKKALRRLTRDQTMAQFLADSGVITVGEVDDHPLRNVLTNVLGTSGGPMPVDLSGHRLEDGDMVLLCSDGLTEMVEETTIARVLGDPLSSPAAACDQLINLALDAGGKDNVTVALGRYRC